MRTEIFTKTLNEVAENINIFITNNLNIHGLLEKRKNGKVIPYIYYRYKNKGNIREFTERVIIKEKGIKEIENIIKSEKGRKRFIALECVNNTQVIIEYEI